MIVGNRNQSGLGRTRLLPASPTWPYHAGPTDLAPKQAPSESAVRRTAKTAPDLGTPTLARNPIRTSKRPGSYGCRKCPTATDITTHQARRARRTPAILRARRPPPIGCCAHHWEINSRLALVLPDQRRSLATAASCAPALVLIAFPQRRRPSARRTDRGKSPQSARRVSSRV